MPISKARKKYDRQELLNSRICDLDISLENSWLAPLAELLISEISKAGMRQFKPRIYVGDEWFSPEGTCAIAVPFFLLDQDLIHLERSFFRVAEGQTKSWAMRLLRHEAGHCFDHAYEVSKEPEWKRLFGDRSVPYRPESYRFVPNHKHFVKNLEEGYAQSHPDEDFAETFAVFLNPRSQWRKHYAKQPVALAKLKYIEDTIARCSRKTPSAKTYPLMSDARRLTSKLSTYYKRRQA